MNNPASPFALHPKPFWDVMYRLLILCICFEEMFAKMTLPLTVLKYVVISILFVKVYSKVGFRYVKVRIPVYIMVFYILLALYFVLSIPSFVDNGSDGIRLFKNFLWLPLLFYFFSNSYSISSRTIMENVHIYIIMMVVYSVLNFAFFFIELPLWRIWHPYWGRMTVGYPTSDVVIQSLALVLLNFSPKGFSKTQKVVFNIIIILSILSQASGTGIILVGVLLISMAIFSLHNPSAQNKETISSCRVSLLSISAFFLLTTSSLFIYLKDKNPDLGDAIEAQIENRVNIMIGREEESKMQVNTMDDRADEFRRVEKELYHNDSFSEFFGCGFGKLTPDSESQQSHVFLEEQYHVLRASMGWFGTLYFFCIFFILFYKTHCFRIGLEYKYLLYTSLVYILMTSFTSGSFCCFGIAGACSLILCFSTGLRIKKI